MFKELYINNKKALIDQDTYFPLTHKVSDLENIDIINMPVSKSIIIKRCKINDDIFGEIGSLTRMNIGSIDGGVGSLYNQIKKCTYQLFDNSVIISKGILTIDGVNDNEYSITLYDELIQKIEDLAGDVDNDEYLLSNCPILDDGTPYTITSHVNTLKNLTNSSPIVPIVCIKDQKLDSKSVRCYGVTGGTMSEDIQLEDLPEDMSSIQLRSIKNWELNYAYSISDMIDSINYQYPDSISYDDILFDTFAEIYMLCNSPINRDLGTTTQYIKYNSELGSVGAMTLYDKDHPTVPLCRKNGHYYMNLFETVEFKANTPSTIVSVSKYDGVVQETFYIGSIPDGTQIGKIWVRNRISDDNGIFGLPTWREFALLYNVNTFITLDGTGKAEYMTIPFNINHEFDFYPEINPNQSLKESWIDLDVKTTNPNDDKEVYRMLNFGIQYQRILSASSTVTYSPLEFKTGEIINGSKIFPKLGIKDFIIQLAKFLNLDIIILDSKLHLQPKKYYVTNEILPIKEITDMNVNNITFDKIQLSNTLPSNDVLTNYKSKYKQDYGSQIVNTGYNVKKNTKVITMDAGIPILMRDYNSYAYDKFTRYFYGGYSTVNHGVINGYDNQLVFGYLNQVNDFTYWSDDSLIESGSLPTSTEIKFTHTNENLLSNYDYPITNENRFSFTTDTFTTTIKKSSYWTFSPYKFSGLNVLKSLEVNKPKVNYARILDVNYPDTVTLYYKYHRNLLIDKYSQDTHILKCQIYIDKTIDIYKIYNYNNTNYIISNIVEYDPTVEGFYEIELMRVNDVNNYITNIIL